MRIPGAWEFCRPLNHSKISWSVTAERLYYMHSWLRKECKIYARTQVKRQVSVTYKYIYKHTNSEVPNIRDKYLLRWVMLGMSPFWSLANWIIISSIYTEKEVGLENWRRNYFVLSQLTAKKGREQLKLEACMAVPECHHHHQ